MSVLMQFAMFPTDKGSSVSKYVSQLIVMIRESGYDYRLSPMGTTIETDKMSEALDFLQKAHDILAPHSDRIYSTVSFDIRKGKEHCLEGKIRSVEEKIGQVKK